jgi:hypothetical protein
MSAPRDLALIQSIQSALAAIRRADGYTWDVSADRVVLDPVNLFGGVGDCVRSPFFQVEAEPEGAREFLPAMQLRDVVVASVMGRIDATGSHPDRRAVLGHQLAAEIERALCVDITRGGLASDTRLRKPSIFQAQSVTDQTVVVVVLVDMPTFRTYGAP